MPNLCTRRQEQYTESVDVYRICFQMEDRLRTAELQDAGVLVNTPRLFGHEARSHVHLKCHDCTCQSWRHQVVWDEMMGGRAQRIRNANKWRMKVLCVDVWSSQAADMKLTPNKPFHHSGHWWTSVFQFEWSWKDPAHWLAAGPTAHSVWKATWWCEDAGWTHPTLGLRSSTATTPAQTPRSPTQNGATGFIRRPEPLKWLWKSLSALAFSSFRKIKKRKEEMM